MGLFSEVRYGPVFDVSFLDTFMEEVSRSVNLINSVTPNEKDGHFTWTINVPGYNKSKLGASIVDNKFLVIKTTDKKELYRLLLPSKLDLASVSIECLDGILTIKAKIKEKEKQELEIEIK